MQATKKAEMTSVVLKSFDYYWTSIHAQSAAYTSYLNKLLHTTTFQHATRYKTKYTP